LLDNPALHKSIIKHAAKPSMWKIRGSTK